MVDLQKYEYLLQRIKENPRKTILILIVILIGGIVIIYTTGYIGEKGRKAASLNDKRENETVNEFKMVQETKKIREKSFEKTNISMQEQTAINKKLDGKNVVNVKDEKSEQINFELLISTANNITSFPVRNQELAKLVDFALKNYRPDYAVKAAQGVTTFPARDEAYSKIMDYYVLRKSFAKAKAITSKISGFTNRNEAIKRLLKAAQDNQVR